MSKFITDNLDNGLNYRINKRQNTRKVKKKTTSPIRQNAKKTTS